MRAKTNFLTQSALIAALYVVLTYVSNIFGLANGVIQVRVSEVLTVLPAFTPAAIPGLAVGCFTANLLTGAAIWDIVFGTLATILGAFGTYCFGKKRYLAPVFPIMANTLIIPFVLKMAYGVERGYSFLFLTLFAGEFISCGILGVLLYGGIEKSNLFRRK